MAVATLCRRLAVLLAALFAAGCAQLLGVKDQAPALVLFIGNSYTFYFQMPAMVSAMGRSDESPRELFWKAVTQPGVALQNHWETGTAQKTIQERKWDYVVLQENSLLPLEDRERMHKYVRLFDEEIKRNGAKTLLFVTWARRDRPATQANLNEAYLSIAKELDAIAAPVGPAWRIARQRAPDVKLYDDDGSHPTPAGSYLTACVLYLAMQPGESRCPLIRVEGVPPEVAEELRGVAAQVQPASK